MEDKTKEPQKIDRLDLEKYELSYLKGRNILTLNGSDTDKLLNALGNDDISVKLPIRFTAYTLKELLKQSKCRRCGGCCVPNPLNPGNPGVEVFEDELKLIAQHLHLPYETLKRKTVEGKNLNSPRHSDQVANTRLLPLPCPFYKAEANECQVHQVRPAVCTIYPIIFGESSTYIDIKVNCDYGKDLVKSAVNYLRLNNPDLVLRI